MNKAPEVGIALSDAEQMLTVPPDQPTGVHEALPAPAASSNGVSDGPLRWLKSAYGERIDPNKPRAVRNPGPGKTIVTVGRGGRLVYHQNPDVGPDEVSTAVNGHQSESTESANVTEELNESNAAGQQKAARGMRSEWDVFEDEWDVFEATYREEFGRHIKPGMTEKEWQEADRIALAAARQKRQAFLETSKEEATDAASSLTPPEATEDVLRPGGLRRRWQHLKVWAGKARDAIATMRTGLLQLSEVQQVKEAFKWFGAELAKPNDPITEAYNKLINGITEPIRAKVDQIGNDIGRKYDEFRAKSDQKTTEFVERVKRDIYMRINSLLLSCLAMHASIENTPPPQSETRPAPDSTTKPADN